MGKYSYLYSYFETLQIFTTNLVDSFFNSKVHPIFFYTLSLILGISWKAEKINFIIILICLLFLIYFIYKNYKNWLKITLFILFAFCVGGIRIYRCQKAITAFHTQFPEEPLWIEGRILDKQEKDGKSFKSNYTVNLLRACNNFNNNFDNNFSDMSGYNRKITGSIKIYSLYQNDLLPDDYIRIYNPIFFKSNNFNNNSYILKNNIQAEMFSYKTNIRLLYRPISSFKQKLYLYKTKIRDNITKKMSPNCAALFCYIFLGNTYGQESNIKAIKENFNYWGISHYLARSGLHVVIFINIIYWILKILFIPLIFRQTILISIMGAYTIFSWTSISFSRALLTFILINFCLFGQVRMHALYIFCLTCSMILIIWPYQLFSLDFQLSFALTFGLVWLNDLKERKLF